MKKGIFEGWNIKYVRVFFLNPLNVDVYGDKLNKKN